MLFPWVIRRVLKVEEPERIVKLNVRAILQNLRDNGHIVADTSEVDMEYQPDPLPFPYLTDRQDWRILDPQGEIRGWVPISPTLQQEDETVENESKTPADEIDETEVLGEVRI